MNRPPSATNTGFNPGNHWAQPNLTENNQVNQAQNNYQNNVTSQPTMAQKQRIENLPIHKPALPEQHIKIQMVFENLRNQCVSKTRNLVSVE